ncbi:MAG: hypothetical protein K1X28_02500 [Parachlamydiales bacterium]|nr:hypothetical protein [Parachlamydiales bacterium]
MKKLFVFFAAATLCMDAQECAVPNTPARFNPECRSFDGFVNLIVWTAREAGADFWAEELTLTTSSSTNNLLEIDFGWDPGFRVGVGYGMNRDGWDTQAYYTWFHTRGKDSISSLPGTIHSSFVGNFYVSNPNGLGLSGPSYQSASIDWNIHYNMFDWELGRSFWVSQALALRPFMGIKGGWINQSMDSTWENPSFSGSQFVNPQTFHKGRENVKNNFWGIGPSIGMNTKWNLFASRCQMFHLLADFSGALMWGHWTFHDSYHNDIDQHIFIGMQNINSGATAIRGFLGFGWEMVLSDYRMAAKLGYESQFWLDQLQYYSFVRGRLSNVLTLQGGTLEFSFDF